VIYLSAVFLALLVVPVVNILSAPNRDAIKWQEQSFLYNMDFVSRQTSRVLYPFGISSNPKQVIIGHDGWLFLGDQYEQTLSVDRRPPTAAEMELGKQIGAAASAWDAYLSAKGVKLFRVMIGPNKGTIYPEHMPEWARPSSPNATDALLAGTGEILYVDLRAPLLEAKSIQSSDLYYKTDTHWNNLGAGIAFRAFAQQVGAAAPDLRWPSNAAYNFNYSISRVGGDLANFLRLSTYLPDSESIIHAADLSVETTQSDFDTKKIMHRGGNPAVFALPKPLLVQTVGALNNKRVLWLRDSFGTAISPLMAATFSDVLQVNWGEAIKPGGRLVQLVRDWKPDYVFFTVVERSSRNEVFANFPPLLVLPNSGDFKPVTTTTPVWTNHLADGRSSNERVVTGNNPFVVFALSVALAPTDARYLSIDLTCNDGTTVVPLQLFWLEDGRPSFDEEHSARISLPTGRNLIDLNTLHKWKSAKAIKQLRMDIDSQNVCSRFKLGNPSLGLHRAAIG